MNCPECTGDGRGGILVHMKMIGTALFQCPKDGKVYRIRRVQMR